MMQITRRGALSLVLGAVGLAAPSRRAEARWFRRDGVAFNTIVSVKLEADDAAQAETALNAAFAEIRRIDRLASLTDASGEVFRLNRDGALERPDAALLEMLRAAEILHEATQGAFDVTLQPLWLAMDAAARRGGWLSDAELRSWASLVDQRAVRFSPDRVWFERPGMQITLNSLARGLAADAVAAALRRLGVARAFFDTDVLASVGEGPWRVGVRHPRRPGQFIAACDVEGCLATSGDYQYFWSPDYARHHIVDPRCGASPADFASVTVSAPTGLMADGLSTAAFLVGERAATALLQGFGAEAFFVSKNGEVSATPGYPVVTAG